LSSNGFDSGNAESRNDRRHIDYFMVRIDPDKITPLKSEAQSKEYQRN